MKAVIRVPVADLRRDPLSRSADAGYAAIDPLQETQLLYGEEVTVAEERRDWLRVQAVEQLKFDAIQGWVGYPGWVRRDQVAQVEASAAADAVICRPWVDAVSSSHQAFLSLTLGTRLRRLVLEGEACVVSLIDGLQVRVAAEALSPLASRRDDTLACRLSVMTLAQQFLGHPYLWGGLSVHRLDWREPLTGVDCSGLVHLVYRAHGIDLPRDAHDQWIQCRKLSLSALRMGDLLFLPSTRNPQRMGHVMLYAGGEWLLEASLQATRVQQITFTDKLGRSLADLVSDPAPPLFCGSCFAS